MLKVLDVFCGLGGWSKGFSAAGFDCTGVDIVNVGYPFDLVLADARKLPFRSSDYFDVIVGSPPCRDFSRLANFGKTLWKDPPNIERGLELVHSFLAIVEELRPRCWLMENVRGLIPHLELRPQQVISIIPNRTRAFWGNFPLFLIVRDRSVDRVRWHSGPLRQWKRAEIPFLTAYPLALACKNHLLERR